MEFPKDWINYGLPERVAFIVGQLVAGKRLWLVDNFRETIPKKLMRQLTAGLNIDQVARLSILLSDTFGPVSEVAGQLKKLAIKGEQAE